LLASPRVAPGREGTRKLRALPEPHAPIHPPAAAGPSERVGGRHHHRRRAARTPCTNSPAARRVPPNAAPSHPQQNETLVRRPAQAPAWRQDPMHRKHDLLHDRAAPLDPCQGSKQHPMSSGQLPDRRCPPSRQKRT
jgi:hypothetical protein